MLQKAWLCLVEPALHCFCCPSVLHAEGAAASWASLHLCLRPHESAPSHSTHNSFIHGINWERPAVLGSSFTCVPCSCFSSTDELFCFVSKPFIYVHSPQKPCSEGINGAITRCKINKSGIKSINPDYWPLSPGSLYKQTWPSSFLLFPQIPVRLSRERKWLNRECRAYSYSPFSKWRNVFWGEGH